MVFSSSSFLYVNVFIVDVILFIETVRVAARFGPGEWAAGAEKCLLDIRLQLLWSEASYRFRFMQSCAGGWLVDASFTHIEEK